MMETPVVFTVGGEQVVGMWHVPASSEGRCRCAVFLHGFTGSKHEAHRLFVVAARSLAAAGIGVLRFDFRGSGDSAGDFSEMTIAREIEDAGEAIRYVRSFNGVDPERVGVVGMSMGGLVAAELMAMDPALRTGVLWCPVGRPDALLTARLTDPMKEQLARAGVTDYGGWPIGRAFIDDLKRRDPARVFSGTRQPVLIVHGDADELVPVDDSLLYLQARPAGDVITQRELVAGADHVFSSLPWTRRVIDDTRRWLDRHL